METHHGKTERPRAGRGLQRALVAAALWALAAPLALAGWPLPDLLRDAKGGKITTRAAFEADQKRKLDIVLREVYGFAPGRPQSTAYKVVEKNPAAMGGAATLKQVDIVMKNDGRSHTMRLVLFTPNKGKKPAPTFLLICNRGRKNIDPTRANKSEFWPAEEAIARGYGIAAFYVGDVDPDDKKDQFKDGVHALMDKTRDASSWGTLAAWAWGASRCMDYFEKDADVDAKRVAVIGHSRGGKAALCAGATDKRFALTVSSCSGCGGAKSFKRNSGQTIKDITTQFPHWFCGNFKKYVDNVQAMEFDQHFLTGAICPRAVYHGSASNDGGADPYGEYLTLVEADRAYQLYGLGGIGNAKEFPEKDQPRHAKNMAYHVRTGDHDLKKWDWEQYMNFADKVFFAGAPTAKISQPAAGAKLVSGEALTVRATATAVNGAIVRAELWVDGAFVRALARAPWAWGDDPACDRALRGLNVGNHTVKVVVFDERGQSATASQTVNVTAAGAATKVEAVEVIDAVSGEVRDVLREGAVVCPALWGGAVNLRAVTNGPVKSVKFRVNDQPVMVTNDAAAFTIAAKGQGWAAPAGKVYLQAIPFSQAWGQGLSGEEFAVSFTVNEASALAVGALTLVDATSGRDLFPLADGQTVNLAATGKKLSLRADALYGTASVQFFLDGQFVRTENVKPFTIMGDDNYGKYYAWTPALGERVVKVLPYSQAYAKGSAGAPIAVKFTVIDDPASAGLPAPWARRDVGAPRLAGDAAFSGALGQGGEFVLQGSGADIWGSADGFHYCYRPASGDVLAQARVSDLVNTDGWAKAGLMIRESLNANARQVMVATTPANGVVLQYRAAAGGASASVALAKAEWLRLERRGDAFVASLSADGRAWREGARVSVTMGAGAFAGLCLSAHNQNALSQARFRDVMVTANVLAPAAVAAPAANPWAHAAIGAPAPAGRFALDLDSGLATLKTSGLGIGGKADSCDFAWRKAKGDFVATLRLVNVDYTNVWARGGLMARASLDAAAPFVMASGTADRGLDLSWREGAGTAAGAIAESARVGASNYSGGWAYRWLRLTRKGNLFTAHWSADGQAWLLLGSRTVALPTEIYVGMAGASAASGAANELLFDNVVLGK